MKIIVKKVGRPCEVREVEKLELEDMQNLVGGFVECMRLDFGIPEHTLEADVWLNEEGKLHKLPPNVVLFNEGGIVDAIVGDIFIADSNDEGETIGLSDEQCDIIPQVMSILTPTIGNADHETYEIPLIAV